MNLELLILKPEKLNVIDNEIIGLMQMKDGPRKDNYQYEELMEKSYAVDSDEIDLFENHKSSIYFCSGWQVKAIIVGKVVLPCHETMGCESPIFPYPELPSMTMRPICQMFVDKYYRCDKFFYSASEFINFFNDLVGRLGENDLEARVEIQDEIIKKLNDAGLFVHFNLR